MLDHKISSLQARDQILCLDLMLLNNQTRIAPMSKLYVGLLVIASMLALSALGMLGLVVITHLINILL